VVVDYRPQTHFGHILSLGNASEGPKIELAPPHQLGGLGERCKLPQRGLGQARSPRARAVRATYGVSGQLSLLPFTGREMSSSLRATGWRPRVADWGGGMSVCCTAGSNCSLARAMDNRIMCRGIISSCQSAATSETVKHFCSPRVHV